MLLDKRLPITWGKWNLVQATLDLLQRAYHERPSAHYQLLSGDSYPIKSNEEIAAKLASGNDGERKDALREKVIALARGSVDFDTLLSAVLRNISEPWAILVSPEGKGFPKPRAN